MKNRANNLSNTSSDMRSHKYPFVIKAKGQDNSNELYYKTIKKQNINNYKTNYNIYKESPSDFDNNKKNNYNIPYNERSMTDNPENLISPSNQNVFIFHKKKIYDNDDFTNNNINNNNNDNDYNDKQPNNSNFVKYDDEQNDPQYMNDNINDSERKDFYREPNERKNNFRTFYLKKDKEYKNLLEDYNTIAAKYNKLKG